MYHHGCCYHYPFADIHDINPHTLILAHLLRLVFGYMIFDLLLGFFHTFSENFERLVQNDVISGVGQKFRRF